MHRHDLPPARRRQADGEVEEITGLRPGETDTEAKFTLEAGSCLGSCSIGPELIVDGKHYGRMTPERAVGVLKQYE